MLSWLRGASYQQDEAGGKQMWVSDLFRSFYEKRHSFNEITFDETEHGHRFSDSRCGRLAQNPRFEHATLLVIMCNAIMIGYDSDYDARYGKPGNLYAGPWFFIFVENFLCMYFTLEVVIRFIGKRKKSDAIRDRWFLFDFVLVFFMVLETWLLPLFQVVGTLSKFSILRLLRLLRITRVARLGRSMPEVMIIVKGMVSACWSVFFVAIFQMLVIYVFAVFFTFEFHAGATSGPLAGLFYENSINLEDLVRQRVDADPAMQTAAEIQLLFGSVERSMFSLFIMGTILDDVTLCTDIIRKTKKWQYLIAFLVFIVVSSFTMLNMLVGKLVEVIQSTAENEKMRLVEEQLRESIKDIFRLMDDDGNGAIPRQEFVDMFQNKSVKSALEELSIRERELDIYASLLYKPNPETGEVPSVGLEDLLQMLLRLRPQTPINSLDFATLRQSLLQSRFEMKTQILRMETAVCEIIGEPLPHLRKPDQGLLHHTPVLSNGNALQHAAPPEPDAERPSLPDDPPPMLAVPDACGLSSDEDRRLSGIPSALVIEELLRRTGLPDLSKTGIPLSWVSPDLQQRVLQAEELGTYGAEAATSEGWSPETLTI